MTQIIDSEERIRFDYELFEHVIAFIVDEDVTSEVIAMVVNDIGGKNILRRELETSMLQVQKHFFHRNDFDFWGDFVVPPYNQLDFEDIAQEISWWYASFQQMPKTIAARTMMR